MSGELVTKDELPDLIEQALKDYRTPENLAESRCISTCLVQRRLVDGPGLSPRQALQEVLTEVRHALENDNFAYADILQGLYWEGHSVGKMLADKRPPELVAERTFYDRRKKAIRNYVQLFLELEQSCRETATTPEIKDAGGRSQSAFVDTVEGPEPPHGSATPPQPDSADVSLPSTPAPTALTVQPGTSKRSEQLQNAQPEPYRSYERRPRIGVVVISGILVLGLILATTLLSANKPSVQHGLCTDSARIKVEGAAQFHRHQGVSSFTVESSKGAILSNKVRSLSIDSRGLWIGYFATNEGTGNGIGQYNKESWAACDIPGEGQAKNINALSIDGKGNVWAAAEKGGVLMYDGTRWHNYTVMHGLSTDETFGLTVDDAGGVWAATWEGVAKFDEAKGRWSIPYKEGVGTIFNNHAHAIAFDSAGSVWVGHMGRGVSHYDNAAPPDAKWKHYMPENSGLGHGEIFDIEVRKAHEGTLESVWFATTNGVSKYEVGKWTTYRTEQGLPDNRVKAVVVDPYNRVWAATGGGVAYLDEQGWVTYHTIPALSIAFGLKCTGCPYDTDHVWTGTEAQGLTHSRMPLPSSVQAIDVLSVGYRKLKASNEPFKPEITVAPGEEIVVQVAVSPRSPYTLTETRGDFLSSIEESEEKRYGAYVQMALEGTVQPGQPFVFTDYDKPFKAPQLPEGVEEQEFVSRWRVWMHTRYVGPVIEVKFKVRRP